MHDAIACYFMFCQRFLYWIVRVEFRKSQLLWFCFLCLRNGLKCSSPSTQPTRYIPCNAITMELIGKAFFPVPGATLLWVFTGFLAVYVATSTSHESLYLNRGFCIHFRSPSEASFLVLNYIQMWYIMTSVPGTERNQILKQTRKKRKRELFRIRPRCFPAPLTSPMYRVQEKDKRLTNIKLKFSFFDL